MSNPWALFEQWLTQQNTTFEEIKGASESMMEQLIAQAGITDSIQKAKLITEFKTRAGYVSIQTLTEKLDRLLLDKNKRIPDPWTRSKRSEEEQDSFKKSLISFYQCQGPQEDELKCMLTGQYFSRDQVRAGHIWKRSAGSFDLIQHFGLTAGDLNSPRNGLLLHKKIEAAFDVKSLTFIYDPFQRRLIAKVLEPALLQNSFFVDLDGKPLLLPNNVYPFRRILSFHARCSYLHAQEMKWIDPFLNIYDYLEFSDGASNIGEEYEDAFPVSHATAPPKPNDLVVKPGEYYGVLKGSAKERINETRKYFGSFAPKKGGKVSALYYKDNKYYNATVLKVHDKVSVLVMFDGYGNKQHTKLSDIIMKL